MSRTVDVDDIADAIVEEFQNYTDEVSEGVEKEVRSKSRDTKNEIKDRSPKDSGDYADDWYMRKTSRGGEIGYTIYNKDHYQLTHLLENGHAIANGTDRVPAYPHISISYKNNVQEMMKNIEKIIENGGR